MKITSLSKALDAIIRLNFEYSQRMDEINQQYQLDMEQLTANLD